MSRRVKYYLIGLVLGCLLLMVLPKPFHRTEQSGRKVADPVTRDLYPVVWRDGYDRAVTVERVPQRLISLAPSITEILYALGAGNRLVANTRFCDFPLPARSLLKIGDMQSPNLELIVQLQPDLVLGTMLSPASLYEQIEAVGLSTVAFKQADLAGVLEDIQTIGRLVGQPHEARQLARKIQDKGNQIDEALTVYRNLSRPRVVLLYDLQGLYSAGHGSWMGDLIELCHAVNIAAEAPSPWPQLSLEGLVEADPEVVLLAVPSDEISSRAAVEVVAALPKDAVWQHLQAVRNGRVATVDKNLLAIPGPRITEALEALAKAIHPEVFGEKDQANTLP